MRTVELYENNAGGLIVILLNNDLPISGWGDLYYDVGSWLQDAGALITMEWVPDDALPLSEIHEIRNQTGVHKETRLVSSLSVAEHMGHAARHYVDLPWEVE